MRILEEDQKHGRIKVFVDNVEDLWHLENIIEPGDLVLALTYRREHTPEEEHTRPQREKRKPVFLGVRVEKVELHRYNNWLRVSGRIEQGEDVSLYHTLNVEPHTTITIVKESWRPYHLERLQRAVSSTKKPLVLVVGVDEGEAEIGVVREYGIDITARIRVNIPGKREAGYRHQEKQRFFTKLEEELLHQVSDEVRAVILAGPGFVKEEFKTYLEEKSSPLKPLIKLENTGSSGGRAVYEVVKRGAVGRVVEDVRVEKETMLVDQLLGEIGRDSKLCVYGYDQVKKACLYGAVSKLLVLDKKLREDRRKVEELMEQVRYSRGELIVVSGEHEAGKQLQALGGVAALLRYPLDEA